MNCTTEGTFKKVTKSYVNIPVISNACVCSAKCHSAQKVKKTPLIGN